MISSSPCRGHSYRDCYMAGPFLLLRLLLQCDLLRQAICHILDKSVDSQPLGLYSNSSTYSMSDTGQVTLFL